MSASGPFRTHSDTEFAAAELALRSATAELVVLRRTIDKATSEARAAKVAELAAEKALAHQLKATKSAKREVAREKAAMEEALARQCARIAALEAELADARRLAGRMEAPQSRHSRPDNDNSISSNWVGRLSLPLLRELERVRGRAPSGLRALKYAARLLLSNLGEALSLRGKVNLPRKSDRESSRKLAVPTPNLVALLAMKPRGRIAVVVHLYYPELWPEFRDALGAIPEPFDLFVTLTKGHSDDAAEWIRTDVPEAQLVILDNLGRDILPFVQLVNSGALFGYELVCKLHTKRSMHRDDGDLWRRALVEGVLPDKDRVTRILAAFDADPSLGVVVADGSLYTDVKLWRKHLPRIDELRARIGVTSLVAESEYPPYPSGSTYWIRSRLLRPIADLKLTATDFEPEPLPAASTPHAIERLMGLICQDAGMRLVETGAIDFVPNRPH